MLNVDVGLCVRLDLLFKEGRSWGHECGTWDVGAGAKTAWPLQHQHVSCEAGYPGEMNCASAGQQLYSC